MEGGQTTAAAQTHAAPSITTTVANTMLVGSFEYASTTNNWTPPTGMTEGVDAASQTRPNDAGISMEMAYETRSAIGATGTRTATADGTSSNNDVGVGHLMALRPQGVPTNIVVTLTGSTDNIIGGSIFLTGTDVGAPEATNTNTNTGATPITTAITTLTNGSWLVDVVGCGNTGTFTAGGSQTERLDLSAASSSGAMSTKNVATAGASSMTQTHTGSNRMAHAVAAIKPSGTIAFSSSANGSANSTNSLTWSHALPASPVGKLIVGVAIEDPTCGGNQVVTSVVHGNTALTYITGVATPAAGFCERVELWYMDVL